MTVNTFSYQPCILLRHSELTHTLMIISLNLFIFLPHLSIYTILCLLKFIFICFSPNSVHATPSDFHSICYASQDSCPHSNSWERTESASNQTKSNSSWCPYADLDFKTLLRFSHSPELPLLVTSHRHLSLVFLFQTTPYAKGF